MDVRGEGRGFKSATEAIETLRADDPGVSDQNLPGFVVVDEGGTPVVLDMDTRTVWKPDLEELGTCQLSPSGRLIMCQAAGSEPGLVTRLPVISVPGGSLQPSGVADHFPPRANFLVPAWSPDGTKVAFVARTVTSGVFLLRNIIPESRR